MRLTPVDILANWYNDETLPWSAQKAVNCLAETAEVGGTRSVAKTKGLPGLTLLVNLETGAPIRGAEDVEGTLFVVSGTSLFQINPDNTAINRGNIPGVSLVSMAHNKQGGTTAANELVIANGLSGYVYNTDTTVLAQITDDAFPGATTFDYVDGYISFTDPEGRFWGHSALNQATQYSSIDRYDAESAPDKIVSHIVSHREVMVFGTRTTEFFRNTGAATGTFQRVDGTEMEVGIAAPLARARLDNTVYWLGNDGIVYRLAGHSPQRVSNRPIEQAISEFNPANAFAHTWEDRGHKVFYLTFPDGLTFGFDVATSLWHARETYGLDRWGINTTTRWNGLWVAGDYSNGKLYHLNWDDFTEDGRPLVMECQPGVTHADGNDVLCPYVELFMDTGQSPNPGDLEVLAITGDAPDEFIGVPYSYAYSATGGFGIYAFTYTGTLPDGLTLSPGGVLSGTPTTGGNFSFTVTVTDSLGQTASVPDTVQISFSSDLWAYTSQLDLRSGLTSAYASQQTITANSPTQTATTMDGGLFAMSSASSPFFRVFENTGVFTEISTPLDVAIPSSAMAVALSSDGTYLAVGYAGNVNIYKRQLDGKWDLIQNVSYTGILHLKFAPNTGFLAACGVSPALQVFRRDGDVFTSIFSGAGEQGDRAGIAWYPDSSKLASTPENGTTSVYNVFAGTIATVAVSTGGTAPGQTNCAFSADGAYLYLRGNAAPFFRVHNFTGTTLPEVAGPSTMPTSLDKSLSVSGDGRLLATANAGGFLVWEIAPGGVLNLLGNLGGNSATYTHFTESGDYFL